AKREGGSADSRMDKFLPRWCGCEDLGSDELCCKLPRLTYWRCSESRHSEAAVADELVASDFRDIHRPALGRRSSGFCDGKAASTKKSLTVSLTVRGNRSAYSRSLAGIRNCKWSSSKGVGSPS